MTETETDSNRCTYETGATRAGIHTSCQFPHRHRSLPRSYPLYLQNFLDIPCVQDPQPTNSPRRIDQGRPQTKRLTDQTDRIFITTSPTYQKHLMIPLVQQLLSQLFRSCLDHNQMRLTIPIIKLVDGRTQAHMFHSEIPGTDHSFNIPSSKWGRALCCHRDIEHISVLERVVPRHRLAVDERAPTVTYAVKFRTVGEGDPGVIGTTEHLFCGSGGLVQFPNQVVRAENEHLKMEAKEYTNYYREYEIRNDAAINDKCKYKTYGDTVLACNSRSKQIFRNHPQNMGFPSASKTTHQERFGAYDLHFLRRAVGLLLSGGRERQYSRRGSL